MRKDSTPPRFASLLDAAPRFLPPRFSARRIATLLISTHRNVFLENERIYRRSSALRFATHLSASPRYATPRNVF